MFFTERWNLLNTLTTQVQSRTRERRRYLIPGKASTDGQGHSAGSLPVSGYGPGLLESKAPAVETQKCAWLEGLLGEGSCPLLGREQGQPRCDKAAATIKEGPSATATGLDGRYSRRSQESWSWQDEADGRMSLDTTSSWLLQRAGIHPDKAGAYALLKHAF